MDNDDLSPKFSQDVYRTQVTEFYPLSVSRCAMLKEVIMFVDTEWKIWYVQRNKLVLHEEQFLC
jgi:hypothetical protein